MAENWRHLSPMYYPSCEPNSLDKHSQGLEIISFSFLFTCSYTSLDLHNSSVCWFSWGALAESLSPANLGGTDMVWGTLYSKQQGVDGLSSSQEGCWHYPASALLNIHHYITEPLVLSLVSSWSTLNIYMYVGLISRRQSIWPTLLEFNWYGNFLPWTFVTTVYIIRVGSTVDIKPLKNQWRTARQKCWSRRDLFPRPRFLATWSATSIARNIRSVVTRWMGYVAFSVCSAWTRDIIKKGVFIQIKDQRLPSGLCFLKFTSRNDISTVRHPDLEGSYSPRTSNRQNPLGPLRPTGPEMKNVPRMGVRGVLAWYSFSRNRKARDARCKSDPGPKSGKGSRCNDDMMEEGWSSMSSFGGWLPGVSSGTAGWRLGCSWLRFSLFERMRRSLKLSRVWGVSPLKRASCLLNTTR